MSPLLLGLLENSVLFRSLGVLMVNLFAISCISLCLLIIVRICL